MLARLIIAGIFGLTAISLHQIAQAEDTKGWGGEIGLNGARTTGNNDTTDIGLAFKLNNRGSDWRHNLRGTMDYGESQSTTNKRRYRLCLDLWPYVPVFESKPIRMSQRDAKKSTRLAGSGLSIRWNKGMTGPCCPVSFSCVTQSPLGLMGN